MHLTQELENKAKDFKNTAPKEVQEQMQKAHDQLVAKKITAEAINAGDKFPEFDLFNQKNEKRTLGQVFGDNKFLVISFYRGGWCPYCNLELKALEDKRNDFLELGASLVAVSPERPDSSISTSEKNNLEFEVLSDINSELSKKIGISFELPENLKPIYSQFGIDIPAHNGENDYTLPVAATFILSKDREIHLAFLDLDYKVRLDPDKVVSKLKEIQK